jgi:hypothetical protein
LKSDLKYGKNTLADAAVLSLSDFERIKKNAVVLTKEEERNQQKIISEQREISQAASKVKYNINLKNFSPEKKN